MTHLLLFANHISPTMAFSYYAGTLVKETTYTTFNVTLGNGTHYLVIDNTGTAAGNYNINREMVSCTYRITFPEEIPENKSQTGQGMCVLYDQIPVIINESYAPPVVTSFEINATSSVTVFVTDIDGFREFEDEFIAYFEADPNVIDFNDIISVIGVIIVIAVVVVIVIWNYQQRKEREAIIERAKETKKLHAQGKGSKIARREEEQTRMCAKCGKPVDPKQKFCMFCGIKFVHIDKINDG